MSYHVWCQCVRFESWFVDTDGPDLPVCECGRPDGEHMDRIGPCTGELILTGGQRPAVGL